MELKTVMEVSQQDEPVHELGSLADGCLIAKQLLLHFRV